MPGKHGKFETLNLSLKLSPVNNKPERITPTKNIVWTRPAVAVELVGGVVTASMGQSNIRYFLSPYDHFQLNQEFNECKCLCMY